MFYFVTTRFYLKTSAIELAEIKRQKLFDELSIPSRIVEIEADTSKESIEHKLNVSYPIINLYDYFLGISNLGQLNEDKVIEEIFAEAPYKRVGTSYVAEDKSIVVRKANGQIYYVDYLDHFGFTDRRDYYRQGHVYYSQFFSDDAKLILSQYYDKTGKPVINKYYRGGPGRSDVLVMIDLIYKGKKHIFKNESELIAFFLDKLAEDDRNNGQEPIFVFDRSNHTIPALDLLSTSPKSYFVFHSLFADKGILRDAYKGFPRLIHKGKLQGLITSTKQEANDLAEIMHINADKIFTIPVTYTNNIKRADFAKRDTNKVILVSRIAEEKNVNDAIKAMINVRKKHPQAYLDIWGYGDDYNNNIALNSAKKIIEDNNALDYIHLRGYVYDLTNEYNTASLQLLTSHYEGFAMSILEGQDHGVPVIAYDVTYGPNEIIEDKKTGFLVKHGQVEDLENKIDQLLSNSSLRQKFSKEAYRNVNKKFSKNVVKEKWQEFAKNIDGIKNKP